MSKAYFNPEGFPFAGGRSPYYDRLMETFYSIYMGLFRAEGEGASPEWVRWLFRRFWLVGHACAFVPRIPKGSNSKVWFAPFTATAWAGNDEPTRARVINPRGVPGYPGAGEILFVANDQYPYGKVALGRGIKTGLPIRGIFDFYARKMVALQEQIEQNNRQAVLPLAFPTSLDREEFKRLVDQALKEHWVYLPVNSEEAAYLNPVATSGTYVADKLIEQRREWFNEAKAMLGVDCAADEKRERLTADEANANNSLVNALRESMQQCLDDFSHNMEYLGVRVRFVPQVEESASVHEEGGKDGDPTEDPESGNP